MVETAGRQAMGKQESPGKRSGMLSHSMLSSLLWGRQRYGLTFQRDLLDIQEDVRFHIEVLNKWLVSS